MDLKSYLKVGASNNEVYDYLNSLLHCCMTEIPKFEELIQVLLEINMVGERLLRFKAEFKNNQDFVTTLLNDRDDDRFKKILNGYNQ